MKLDAFDFSSAVFEFALGLIRVYDQAYSHGRCSARTMVDIYTFKITSAEQLAKDCATRHDAEGRALYADMARSARIRRDQYQAALDQATK